MPDMLPLNKGESLGDIRPLLLLISITGFAVVTTWLLLASLAYSQKNSLEHPKSKPPLHQIHRR